jgi:DNA-binding MarR family transcriptional regulator
MIKRVLQKLAPVIGQERADALWLAYHTEEEIEEKREIEGIIYALAAQYLDETCWDEQILLRPPPPEKADGIYQMGTVYYGETSLYPFGLREGEMPQHLGIYGRTGAGKTNLIFKLLENLIRHNKAFLVFDWKQGYRAVLQHHPQAGIKVLTVGSDLVPFHFNPLDVTDIKPEQRMAYLREVISVLINVYFRDMHLLSVEGVEYLLLRAADDILRDEAPLSFRTMYEWSVVHKGTYREKDWKSSMLNVLYKVTTGPIGSVVNAPQTTSIPDLLSQKTILELNWLGSSKDKAFFIQLLLLKIYHHALQRSQRNQFALEVVIEEAHNILLRHAARETVAEMVLRQIRELGVGICLTDQHPYLISIPALGTYCTISLNLKAEQDVRAMGAAMLLDQDQQKYLGRLPTGWGIVKLQDRFTEPFLVRFPLTFSSHKILTDAQLVSIMKERFPDRFPPTGQPREQENDNNVADSMDDQVPDIKNDRSSDLTEGERTFLLDIIEHPFSGAVERYQRLGLSAGQGNRIQKRLVEKGWIQVATVSTGKGGVKLLALTEHGEQTIAALMQCEPSHQSKRHGGLSHRYWVDLIARTLEHEGYSVEKEHSIGEGSTVDLVAEKDGEWMAIEVETGKSDVTSNIGKSLGAGFSTIVIVVPDKQAREELNLQLQKMAIDRNQVRVVTVREMVRGQGW